MNMYTAPEYRRQGIALHTLHLLVKEAKKQGVSQIEGVSQIGTRSNGYWTTII